LKTFASFTGTNHIYNLVENRFALVDMYYITVWYKADFVSFTASHQSDRIVRVLYVRMYTLSLGKKKLTHLKLFVSNST